MLPYSVQEDLRVPESEYKVHNHVTQQSANVMADPDSS